MCPACGSGYVDLSVAGARSCSAGPGITIQAGTSQASSCCHAPGHGTRGGGSGRVDVEIQPGDYCK